MPRPKKKAPISLEAKRVFRLRLDAASAAPGDNGARWIQVAYEGAWKGYARGEFSLSQSDLQQMVDNFHRHPAFKLGAELANADALASGAYDVVPFDWRHASTQPVGASGLEHQVAQAWACDMQVRRGADGGAELWVYCRYLEPMGSYVREGKVHWTSITADPHFVDPVTGQDRGWYIEAVAFTNDPFLQGMHVIAAERAAGQLALWRDMPTSPAEVVECLREVFGLPETAGAVDVAAEIAKLKEWTASGAAPVGVDLSELIGRIRQIFNLPTLAPTGDVFAAADALLAAIATATAEPPTEAGPSLDRTPRSTNTMNPHLAKLLTAITAVGITLGRASTDDEAVDVIRDWARDQKLKLDKSNGGMESLSAILTALGTEDVPGATKKIAEMFKSCAMLEKALPELKALRDSQGADEDAATEKDVDEALAAHRMPDAAREALVAMRTGGAKRPAARETRTVDEELTAQAEHSAWIARRKEAKASFDRAYPVDPRAAALTRQALPPPLAELVAGRTALPKKVELDVRPVGPGIGGGEVIDLSPFAGNNTEKALAFLEKRGDFKPTLDRRGNAIAMTRPQKFAMAARLLKQANVVGKVS